MVYKKYIKRNGKVFGPYYYESYREDGKVKTRFVSGPKKSDKFSQKRFLYLFFMILVLVLVFVGIKMNFGVKDLILLQPDDEFPPEDDPPTEEFPPEDDPPTEEFPPEDEPPPEEILGENSIMDDELMLEDFEESEGEEPLLEESTGFTKEETTEYLESLEIIKFLDDDIFECEEFNECTVFYNSDNINNEGVALRGIKTRICKNGDVEIIQRESCVPTKSITFQKIGDTLMVYDFETSEIVAEIVIVKKIGESDKLNIEIFI